MGRLRQICIVFLGTFAAVASASEPKCEGLLVQEIEPTLERFSPYQVSIRTSSEDRPLEQPSMKWAANDLMFDFDASQPNEMNPNLDGTKEIQAALAKGLPEIQKNIQKTFDKAGSKVGTVDVAKKTRTAADETMDQEAPIEGPSIVEYGSVSFVSTNLETIGLQAKLEFDLLEGGRVLTNLHYKFYFKSARAEDGLRTEREYEALKILLFSKVLENYPDLKYVQVDLDMIDMTMVRRVLDQQDPHFKLTPKAKSFHVGRTAARLLELTKEAYSDAFSGIEGRPKTLAFKALRETFTARFYSRFGFENVSGVHIGTGVSNPVVVLSRKIK